MDYDTVTKSPGTSTPGLPLVSFTVLTYGRCAKQPALLNEVVFWALAQDYPNVEVVLLNDAPGQTLVCGHPCVKCVNLDKRAPDLGTKSDLAVLFASGSVVCVNDDDDISLPGRAGQAVTMLGGYDYWAPFLWLYAHRNAPAVFDGNGYSYNASAFKRESMLGNHPKAIKGHDMEAAGWAEKHLRCSPHRLTDPKDVQFVYRWNTSFMHLSGCNDPVYSFTHNYPGPDGVYEVVPAPGDLDWTDVKERALARV